MGERTITRALLGDREAQDPRKLEVDVNVDDA